MVILYTSETCPKCKILKEKLNAKGIEYKELVGDEIPKEKEIVFVPVLEIEDGTMLNFVSANKWVNEKIRSNGT